MKLLYTDKIDDIDEEIANGNFIGRGAFNWTGTKLRIVSRQELF